MEAMLHWVNAVFYLFKEGQPPAAQMFNLRWIRRARTVMERMNAVAPDWHGGAVHFVWGLYYLSLPERAGGDRARSAACFEKAIELGPDMLMSRWGRGKYYQIKMRNARGFEEDLRWVVSRDAHESGRVRLERVLRARCAAPACRAVSALPGRRSAVSIMRKSQGTHPQNKEKESRTLARL